jgi:hypothetical protein
MKDLVIGAIGDYQFDQIQNWVNSLNQSGFEGDKILISYNSNQELVEKLTENGIEVYSMHADAKGQRVERFITNSGEVNASNAHLLVHNVRFFHMWQLLKQFQTEGRTFKRIIHTDVRDVIFQNNPSDWLDMNMRSEIVSPSESVKYWDEPWNRDNFRRSFGDVTFMFQAHEMLVSNVGSFAAKYDTGIDLCLHIYLLTVGQWHTDQPAFNLIVNTVYKDRTQWAGTKEHWAAQIGALIEARPKLGDAVLEPAPTMNEDGLVVNENGNVFPLLHQYERVPGWYDKLTEKYSK